MVGGGAYFEGFEFAFCRKFLAQKLVNPGAEICFENVLFLGFWLSSLTER